MEVSAKEASGATKWFWIAGTIAVVLSYALFRADEGLTHSKREQILGETLRELRTAQSSVSSAKTEDPRVANGVGK